MAVKSTKVEYKQNVMERLGGESTFEFIVLKLTERLRIDPKLQKFFKDFDAESLDILQRQFLTAALAKHPEGYDVDGYILLRYYSLLRMGFNEKHFDVLVDNLVDALDDSWVDNDVVEDVIRMVKSFREIFVNRKQRDLSRDEEKEAKEAISKSVEEAKVVVAERRSSSGEFLLDAMKVKGSKRSKQIVQ